MSNKWGRTRSVHFRITEREAREISDLSDKMEVSESEVWRRVLMTIRVIYDSDLSLLDALVLNNRTAKIHRLLKRSDDIPLYEAIKPIPELIKILEAKETIRALKASKRS